MKKTDTILDEIVAYTKQQLTEKKKQTPLRVIERKITQRNIRDFKKALQKERVALIAEIKRKSPSKGVLQDKLDHKTIAHMYEQAAVDAVSVLTEPKYFQGNVNFLPDVKEIVSVPVLRKDFISDPYQVYESRFYGADAFLLIARLFAKKELKQLFDIGKSLGMEMLVEAHEERDLEMALEIGAEVIGINNRDLKTFVEDLSTFERLAPLVPKSTALVAESAIKSRSDVKRVELAGAKAILVGTALMRSVDISATARELTGRGN